MSNERTDERRMDRQLDGSYDGADRVTRLIAAARAPGRRHELAGEEAAMQAFRSTHSPHIAAVAPVADLTQARHARSPRHWAGRTGVKVAAAAALVVGAAGVAVAATTGILPTPIIDVSASSTGPGSPYGTPNGPRSSGADTRTQTPGTESGSATTGVATPGASASPGAAAELTYLVGLCESYRSHGDRDPGKSMDSTAFQRLVTAAGSAAAVPAYCDTLLGPAPMPAASTPAPAPTTGGGQGSNSQGVSSQGATANEDASPEPEQT